MFDKKLHNYKKQSYDHLFFPAGFLWGTATSSHQTEGGNFNDWSEWEKENAKIKMQNAKLRNWSKYLLEKYPNPLQRENYISGRACDHYNRYEEDFDIIKKLNNNAHRLSIEWSRIEPREGEWNIKEIGHYRKVLLALKKRNIEPFVTLWHWTCPIWFSQKGGFENRESPFYFGRYAEKVVGEFGDLVNFWITINEPLVITGNSYLKGIWPPQEKNIFSFIRVVRNLAKAHKTAYGVIKQLKPRMQVGIAHNMSFFEVERSHFINKILKRFGEWRKNFWFLNAISGYQDFIGFNYYSSYQVNLGFSKVKTARVSDMGWGIYPKGIYLMLRALKSYNKPIFITENGLADTRDQYRTDFIKNHLVWVHRAIQDGINVRGYFHWSLLDNFEWDKGFWPRFGLVEVDYKTLERKIRDSAFVYGEVCGNNGLEI